MSKLKNLIFLKAVRTLKLAEKAGMAVEAVMFGIIYMILKH